MMHTQDATQFDRGRFRQVLGTYPTGVTVITAIDQNGKPAGLAVGTFTSVSLDPPLIAFLPTKTSTSFPRIREAHSFCVNVLSAKQENVCRQFSISGADKFQGLDWHPSPLGAPIIEGALAWVECIHESVIESGDHFIVIGKVTALDSAADGDPLIFFRGSYRGTSAI